MSFTVDLILTDVPNEKGTDWKYIEELREEYYEDKSDAHEKLIKLHRTRGHAYIGGSPTRFMAGR